MLSLGALFTEYFPFLPLNLFLSLFGLGGGWGRGDGASNFGIDDGVVGADLMGLISLKGRTLILMSLVDSADSDEDGATLR